MYNSYINHGYINKEYEEEKSCHSELVSESGSQIQEICTTKTTKYIDINGKKIATVETIDSNPEKLIYHQDDYLGGASIDLDEQGNTLQIVDYYPYGKLRKEDHTDNYKNKYLYSNKERDEESKLDYFEARYYDSEVGRFRSVDRVYWEVGNTERGQGVLNDPQQQNAYSYARNNPIIYTDPSGNEVHYGAICFDSERHSYFFDADDFTVANAFGHFLYGKGISIGVDISDVNFDIPDVSKYNSINKLLNDGKKGEYKITDKLAITINLDDKAIFGNVTTKLKGKLIIKDGKWNFNGNIKLYDDYYDFNKSTHRNAIAELSTFIGKEIKKILNGINYDIFINGEKKVEQKGVIPKEQQNTENNNK